MFYEPRGYIAGILAAVTLMATPAPASADFYNPIRDGRITGVRVGQHLERRVDYGSISDDLSRRLLRDMPEHRSGTFSISGYETVETSGSTLSQSVKVNLDDRYHKLYARMHRRNDSGAIDYSLIIEVLDKNGKRWHIVFKEDGIPYTPESRVSEKIQDPQKVLEDLETGLIPIHHPQDIRYALDLLRKIDNKTWRVSNLKNP
jgi:hypothetical protein|tara:strand:+ start:622 stop:1230 length:609 start_codon:yes stop_codon:yes gene_type:complete